MNRDFLFSAVLTFVSDISNALKWLQMSSLGRILVFFHLNSLAAAYQPLSALLLLPAHPQRAPRLLVVLWRRNGDQGVPWKGRQSSGWCVCKILVSSAPSQHPKIGISDGDSILACSFPELYVTQGVALGCC